MREDSACISDLQQALEWLTEAGDPPVSVSTPVDPRGDLAGAYARFGGGVPLSGSHWSDRSVLFENVGATHSRVLVGLFASRLRCAQLLGCDERGIAETLIEASQHPIPPVVMEGPSPCQEVIVSRPDLSRLPIITSAIDDAGPYITMGVVLAADQDGAHGNISIHRLCVQSEDSLTIWMVPGRDLEQLYLAAKAQGRRLPISINIGVDPAIYIAAACTSPLAPQGFNELGIAGAVRRKPVVLVPCRSQSAMCIASAEYVIEGEICHETVAENQMGTKSMPEFLGYDGASHPGLPVVRVTAITHRERPVFQAVIGPGHEQSHLLAFGMEAAVLDFLRRHSLPCVSNVRAHAGGGGQLLLFVQVQKRSEQDDGAVRRGGAAILGAFRMVKQVVLVDNDVNLFCDADVWWAMATRFQASHDALILPSLQGFPLDPSQSPDFLPSLAAMGMTDKVVFDCTVPFKLWERFRRSRFESVSDEALREMRGKTCE